MFDRKTVFILGAGASWHYGYPTGEDLVKKVIEKADKIKYLFKTAQEERNNFLPNFLERKLPDNSLLNTRIHAWETAQDNCAQLINKLRQVNPPVIDYFLGQSSEDTRELAKFIIAWVILDCQKTYLDLGGNVNRKAKFERSPFSDERDMAKKLNVSLFNDDWGKFILYKIVGDCEKPDQLLENDVTFVTFNYDTSLEQKLRDGLLAIDLFNMNPETIDEFIKSNHHIKDSDNKYIDRFIHLYGKVDDSPNGQYSSTRSIIDNIDRNRSAYGESKRQEEYRKLLNAIYQISTNLRVISEDKHLDKKQIEAATKAIERAEDVYILGYGFDERNSKRIKIDKFLYVSDKDPHKRVFFTNFENKNSINKKASKIFFRDPSKYYPSSSNVMPGNYERSTLDVYSALERDFEL
ncbi:MAG: hypothetical protein WC464_07435 [Bdellovibrionales bacterium]